jgi:abortive infection bacteriophage resistance protein
VSNHFKQLRFIDQLALLKLRGVRGIGLRVSNYKKDNDESRKRLLKNLNKLSEVGYYTLKNYAAPFFNQETGKYERLQFRTLIARYYRDKHFKQATLHAIEDIEVALNTRIAYLLGKKYGAFDYIKFHLWCQRNGYNRYINRHMNKFVLKQEEYNFLQKLVSSAKKSSNKSVVDFENNSEQAIPPVWLAVNLLTLGESIRILELMSKKNREVIANQFNCKVDELISWLKCINLIRNICCHNENLIDIKLKTKPSIPQWVESKDILYSVTQEDGSVQYTNAIALPLVIIITLMKTINSKYRLDDLSKSLSMLTPTNRIARQYGFKSISKMHDLFKSNQEDEDTNIVIGY